jgi:hypothetical protein
MLEKSDSVLAWSVALNERAFQTNAHLLDIAEFSQAMRFLFERVKTSDFTLTSSGQIHNEKRTELSPIHVTFTNSTNKHSITLELKEHSDERDKAFLLSRILSHVYRCNEQLSVDVRTKQLRIEELSSQSLRSNNIHTMNRTTAGQSSSNSYASSNHPNKVQERTSKSLINPTIKRRKPATGVNYDDDDDDSD